MRCSAVLQLAERTGARLAWVPRRAGERGAIDAGALPTLLPGGRPVTDAAPRAEVERLWGRPRAGRSRAATPTRSWPRAAERSSAALVVGGVDPADLPDPAAGRRGARPGRLRRQPRDRGTAR